MSGRGYLYPSGGRWLTQVSTGQSESSADEANLVMALLPFPVMIKNHDLHAGGYAQHNGNGRLTER